MVKIACPWKTRQRLSAEAFPFATPRMHELLHEWIRENGQYGHKSTKADEWCLAGETTSRPQPGPSIPPPTAGALQADEVTKGARCVAEKNPRELTKASLNDPGEASFESGGINGEEGIDGDRDGPLRDGFAVVRKKSGRDGQESDEAQEQGEDFAHPRPGPATTTIAAKTVCLVGGGHDLVRVRRSRAGGRDWWWSFNAGSIYMMSTVDPAGRPRW